MTLTAVLVIVVVVVVVIVVVVIPLVVSTLLSSLVVLVPLIVLLVLVAVLVPFDLLVLHFRLYLSQNLLSHYLGQLLDHHVFLLFISGELFSSG